MMNRRVLLLLALFLCLGLTVVVIRSSGTFPEGALETLPQNAQEQEASLSAEALLAEKSAEEQLVTTKGHRQRIDKDEKPAIDPKHFYLLHGRCIAAETGFPLSNCKVLLNVNQSVLRDPENIPSWVQHAVSDDKGKFSLRLRKYSNPRLILYAKGRAILVAMPGKVRELSELDIGDLFFR